MFYEDMREAMEKKGMTASDLSRATGIGKSSISQYLHGTVMPPPERVCRIGKALDTTFGDLQEPISPFDRADVATVAKALHIGKDTLRKGIRDGVFPWAYAIHTSENHWVYVINAKKFRETEL